MFYDYIVKYRTSSGAVKEKTLHGLSSSREATMVVLRMDGRAIPSTIEVVETIPYGRGW